MGSLSNISASDEKRTWEALQRGDESALRCIFDWYYRALLTDAYRLTANKEIARDIVQEVFVEIWKKRERIAVQLSVKAYLRKSVLNRSLNYLRTRHRLVLDLPDDLPEQPDESPQRLADLLETEEIEAKVRHAIETLPEKCRIIFVLSRFEKMSHKAIASELDISVKTVENQITKAIKTLREALT